MSFIKELEKKAEALAGKLGVSIDHAAAHLLSKVGSLAGADKLLARAEAEGEALKAEIKKTWNEVAAEFKGEVSPTPTQTPEPTPEPTPAPTPEPAAAAAAQ